MLKERLNIVLYDDSEPSSGGGDWDLNIDPSALESAADDYVKAVTNYRDAKTAVITAFNNIASDTSWQDVSNTDYKDKIKEIVARLDAIETTLVNNSTNLKAIASYARETENNVHVSVNGIE
jgi:uncharacterized protein YukE